MPPDFTDGFLSLFIGQTKTSALDIPALKAFETGAPVGTGLCSFAPLSHKAEQDWQELGGKSLHII